MLSLIRECASLLFKLFQGKILEKEYFAIIKTQ